MSGMEKKQLLICSFCNYTTKRKYNLERHQINKHSNEIITKMCNINTQNNGENVVSNGENVVSNGENVVSNGENVVSNFENVNPYDFKCKKCNKVYKSRRYLFEHQKKCNRLDNLTCPRCMVTFADRYTKSKHIKRSTCKPRSIFCANTPNSQNIEVFNNIEKQYNNYTTNNNTNNNINNTIHINNYGNERLDYIDFNKFLSIFKKYYDIPSALTKEIHFNSIFPENNNILYNDKKTSLIKKNGDKYIEKDTRELAEDLLNNKTRIIQNFAHINKKYICESIDIVLYDEIIELLLKLIVKEPMIQYKKQINKIKELIKNKKNV